MSGITKRIVNL